MLSFSMCVLRESAAALASIPRQGFQRNEGVHQIRARVQTQSNLLLASHLDTERYMCRSTTKAVPLMFASVQRLTILQPVPERPDTAHCPWAHVKAVTTGGVT
jgi:hypothetical protein